MESKALLKSTNNCRPPLIGVMACPDWRHGMSLSYDVRRPPSMCFELALDQITMPRHSSQCISGSTPIDVGPLRPSIQLVECKITKSLCNEGHDTFTKWLLESKWPEIFGTIRTFPGLVNHTNQLSFHELGRNGSSCPRQRRRSSNTVSVLLNRQTVQCLTWRKRGGYRFIPFEFTNGSLQSTQCKRHVVSGQFGIRPCGLRGGLRDGSPLRISPCRAYKVHQGCVRFHRS